MNNSYNPKTIVWINAKKKKAFENSIPHLNHSFLSNQAEELKESG